MLLRRRTLLSTGVSVPLLAFAGSARAADLQPALGGLERFIGKWRGEGDGQPGHSTVERSYEPDLGGLFLVGRNRSTYAPQEKNPKGEVHRDLGYYGWDKARKCAVLRQFHSEGFVVQYVCSTPELGATELVFDSESIENIPAGFRSRETCRFTGWDAFEELFEIAEPGKDFELYSHNRLERV
ncbi:FABP family protein [Sphingomonas sp. LB-2]|uniref:FABP family protein n=1 Tax=Sphingomonas caeni TaxID=2984949 RepID=UPI00222F7DC7|nr:FABP family protein [Sphingomonas caeni]MCW3848166.1 FABP family protein [Sphingomonas caeni]